MNLIDDLLLWCGLVMIREACLMYAKEIAQSRGCYKMMLMLKAKARRFKIQMFRMGIHRWIKRN